jgi:hypothetical protein
VKLLNILNETLETINGITCKTIMKFQKPNKIIQEDRDPNTRKLEVSKRFPNKTNYLLTI